MFRTYNARACVHNKQAPLVVIRLRLLKGIRRDVFFLLLQISLTKKENLRIRLRSQSLYVVKRAPSDETTDAA